jgi:two-component system OmpR family response regulator
MVTVLIVEDDENQRRLLAAVLKREGYETIVAADAEEAFRAFDEHVIELAVFDVMMPGVDGFELTRMLREAGYDLPILIVTAKRLPTDKRQGFLAGTDDYMTKPIEFDEMILRIRALLRRAHISHERRLVIGEIILDSDTMTVTRGDDTQTLPHKEFLLLYKLLSYPNRIFTRIQLMDEIWGIESESQDQTVNVHINRLRRKFEGYPEFELATVRGLGYKAVVRI